MILLGTETLRVIKVYFLYYRHCVQISYGIQVKSQK